MTTAPDTALTARTTANTADTASTTDTAGTAAGTATATASTRAAVGELLARIQEGSPERVADLFAEKVDWHIAENPTVPWIRPRSTRADVAAHFRELAEGQVPVPEGCSVDAVVVDGEEAMISGRLMGTVTTTGKVFRSPFVMRVTVRDGLIIRYLIVEDSLAIAAACARD
ncbi:nuclear transport factor 2 family protein [Streptomyces sp. NPDC004609]|uniref:nuclear transport factor 2 family protein n=1 Tax=Streptomyces sp. NPDC004609 TaxID=3364704 RepID=UPI00367C854D